MTLSDRFRYLVCNWRQFSAGAYSPVSVKLVWRSQAGSQWTGVHIRERWQQLTLIGIPVNCLGSLQPLEVVPPHQMRQAGGKFALLQPLPHQRCDKGARAVQEKAGREKKKNIRK